jgi:hypothetical protein
MSLVIRDVTRDRDTTPRNLLVNKTKKKAAENHAIVIGAKSQYCATKRAVFMESCLSSLSALGSKIRVNFQNKIPFQRTKTLKTVGCTLQRK